MRRHVAALPPCLKRFLINFTLLFTINYVTAAPARDALFTHHIIACNSQHISGNTVKHRNWWSVTWKIPVGVEIMPRENYFRLTVGRSPCWKNGGLATDCTLCVPSKLSSVERQHCCGLKPCRKATFGFSQLLGNDSWWLIWTVLVVGSLNHSINAVGNANYIPRKPLLVRVTAMELAAGDGFYMMTLDNMKPSKNRVDHRQLHDILILVLLKRLLFISRNCKPNFCRSAAKATIYLQ